MEDDMIGSKEGRAVAVGTGDSGIAAAVGSENFTVSGQTASMLVELQKAFAVTSNAEVIRKALVLANLASQHAGPDHTITIASGDGKAPVKISLVE